MKIDLGHRVFNVMPALRHDPRFCVPATRHTYFAWWKQTSSKTAFAGPLRSRGFFDPLHHTFVEVVRERAGPHAAPALGARRAPARPAAGALRARDTVWPGRAQEGDAGAAVPRQAKWQGYTVAR